MGLLYPWKTKSYGRTGLKVPDGAIAPAQVFAHVQDEGQTQVHDYRGSKCEEGGINEEQTYAGRGDAKLLAHGRAHAESMILKKLTDPFHLLHRVKTSFASPRRFVD